MTHRDRLQAALSAHARAPRFDYARQAWIGADGRYQRCGHPDSMACACYGRAHAGEVAPADSDTGAHDGTLDAAEHRASHPEQYDAGDDGDRNAPAPSYDGPAFQSADVARSFVLGGRAIFTLVSEATGARYTYRVTQGKPRPGDSRPAPWFVSLLTGPDNTSEYTYMGMIDPSTGAVRVTRASAYTADTVPVRAIDWYMRHVFAGRVPAGVRMYHCGRCGRCGRLLTVPASIESGFGPECMARMEAGE